MFEQVEKMDHIPCGTPTLEPALSESPNIREEMGFPAKKWLKEIISIQFSHKR